MEVFDTSRYELVRKEDNTIVRLYGGVFEEPELTQSHHVYNKAFFEQKALDAEAQLEKLKAFELENPAVEVEEVSDEHHEELSHGDETA